MSVNKVILLGNLGQDPKLYIGQEPGREYKIASVSLATSVKWKDKEGNDKSHTEWHDLLFKDKLADVVMKHLKKGAKIYVEGALKTKISEKDGQKFKNTSISVHRMEMCGAKLESQTEANVEAHAGDDLPF